MIKWHAVGGHLGNQRENEKLLRRGYIWVKTGIGNQGRGQKGFTFIYVVQVNDLFIINIQNFE